MIFVTVGLDIFPFDRLIKSVDSLIDENIIKEDTFIQIGSSEYKPINCPWEKVLNFESFIEKVCNARIVITHAGVGNIITCLNHNKIPITVPRQRLYGEHVDNHQLEFIKEFEKLNSVIPVYNISHLKTYIEQYDKIAAKKVLRKNNTDTVINYFQELFLKF